MSTSSTEHPRCRDNGTLRIWIAEGHRLEEWVARFGWRGLARRPGLLLDILGSEVVSRLWRTRLRHVLIERNGVVLDVQWRTSTVYISEFFQQKYPRVIGSFDFPAGAMAISGHRPVDEPVKPWLLQNLRFYLMLASFGIYRTESCIDVAGDYLRDAGVDVPRSVWRPHRLVLHLLESGYEWIPFEPPADSR